MRESRATIFGLSTQEIEELAKAARIHKSDSRLDQIRRVCLCFDEIGYFVYKVGIVKFRDILDIYTQTVTIWNKISPIVLAWREYEGASSFVYFEMLARQERLKVTPLFADPVRLYGSSVSANSNQVQAQGQGNSDLPSG